MAKGEFGKLHLRVLDPGGGPATGVQFAALALRDESGRRRGRAIYGQEIASGEYEIMLPLSGCDPTLIRVSVADGETVSQQAALRRK
mgnify:CR=1 FL=1